jgi:uncharacterized membrane protein
MTGSMMPTNGAHAKPRHRRRWYNPIALSRSLVLRPKIIVAILVAVATFFALQAFALVPDDFALAGKATMSWNAGGLVYLLMAYGVMRSCGEDKIRMRAARQDDSALAILVIVLVSIAVSFIAIAFLLGDARSPDQPHRAAYLTLAGLTIIISWWVTQAVFTFHYAHEFYAPPERQKDAEKGLVFPDDDKPDYWDFLYFAATIGTTSATSDTGIRSKSMRRLVTLHAIVSFFFNTMVLALTINLAASLL